MAKRKPGRPRGTKQSDEWKHAQSERMKKYWASEKGDQHREAMSERMTEAWSDPDRKKQQSRMIKRRYKKNPEKWARTPEQRKRASEYLAENPIKHTKEQHEKIAAANRGRIVSEETRRKISEAKKGQKYRVRSEEHTKHQAEAQAGRPKTEDQKKRISESLKKYFQTDAGREQVERQSQKLKDFYQEHPEKAAENMSRAQAANPKWNDTKPEKQMAAILDDLGLSYKKQHRFAGFGKHRFHKWDFALIEDGVLIEVDGCYWHGCPEHTNKKRRAELVEQAAVEVERDALAQSWDWLVLRFWQCKVRDKAGEVAGVVLKAVKHQRRMSIC